MSFVVLLILAVIVTVSGDCPNGWTRFGDFCYRLYRNTTEWPLALFDCEKNDAYLATPDTPEKIQYTHALMTELNGDENDRVWIGLTDTRREGTWVWELTGQNATHLNWGAKEPNGHGTSDQDCAMMYGKVDFKWADDPCHSHF